MSAPRVLPAVPTSAAFDALARDRDASDAVLRVVAEAAGFPAGWERPARGSALVALGPHEVLKVMAPLDADLSRTEAACLRTLDGRLPVSTPSVVDAGELDGWRWLRMTRLPGEELADAWGGLSRAEQLDLGTQLGEAIAVMHGLEAPPEVERLDWAAWMASRLPTLVEDQRRKGCPEALLDGLEDFVRGADRAEGRTAWLHTEIMREHLLVARTPEGVRLSGLFDFEPSWVGPAHYELASVGLFVSAGDPVLFGRILGAAGVSASPRRLFALAMLHRYANLGWYVRRLGGDPSLPSLAERWFGAEG